MMISFIISSLFSNTDGDKTPTESKNTENEATKVDIPATDTYQIAT